MKICEFADKIKAEVLSMPRPDAEISGGYCGDLLSWVMGNGQADMVWVTIMTNINVVAVASLIDFSAVILAEGCVPDDDVIAAAKQRGINLLVSERSSYEVCVALGGLSV